MSDFRAMSVLSDDKKNELRERLNQNHEEQKQKREEFRKKVEERKAELANSANAESYQDAAARVDAMREDLYKLEIKKNKAKNEERVELDRKFYELFEVLRIEESAVGISHQLKPRPKSYFRKRRIKRLILTISIVIVVIIAIVWIMH